MLFNVILVIFLIFSFMITFSSIGTCLIRLKALGACIDNIHETQAKMHEVMMVTAEYDAQEMILLDEMAHAMTSIKYLAKRSSIDDHLGEHLQDIYDELLKISEDIESNRSEIVNRLSAKFDAIQSKPIVTLKTNTAVGDPTKLLAGLTAPIVTGGTTSAPIAPEIPAAKKSSSKTVRKNAVKAKK